MAVVVTHAVTATAPNDPAKEVSSDAWNEGHTVTGLGDAAEKNVGTGAGDVAAGTAPAAAVATHVGLADPHTQYALEASLGTAATTAATDYATAAQGATADSALQPAGNGSALTGLTKTQVGLANVDNTSDASKPVSSATQTALDLKANLASPTFTGTVGGVTAAMVGLGNCNNTSDASKPVSTATQTALDGKQATLVSATNIKTINGSSVLGSGDLVVVGSGDGLGTDGDKGDITVGGTGTTLTIDNAAVTLAKMANLAESTVVGRAAGAGTGVPTALSVAQLIAVLGAAATPISQVAIKTVEASGDYTPTAGMKYCICILTGSGGGGGGADSSTTTNDIGVGGGGGAGTTRIGFFTAADIGASKAVVLNAGGAAGSATNGTTGSTPSDNTFGSTLLVAPGGLGGVGSGVATEALNAQLGGAGGGAGSGGVFGTEGGAGGSAMAIIVDGTVGDGSVGFGGIGGSSFWGGGGRGGALFSTTIGVSAVSAGTAGKAHGSGGGGAVCSDTQAGADGGAGKIGIFVAIEFI